MGEQTGIAWTDHTFNPWWGCQRVSPGCEHCYAEAFSKRLGLKIWGPTERRFFGDGHWREPLLWDEKAHREGVRRRVFCASMADVFEDRPELAASRARLYRLIENTPSLDWLLLTKRPENAPRLWEQAQNDWCASCGLTDDQTENHRRYAGVWGLNVWLGTTVEDQKRADERIPALLKVPAAVRFLSCEPLLEEVDLGLLGMVPKDIDSSGALVGERINWVIVGGESGSHARPFDLAWAIDVIVQCRVAGVVPFMKQAGAVPTFRGHPFRLRSRKGDEPGEWPESLQVREFPRSRSVA